MSSDANVDALVIGLAPLSPAMRALADTSSGRYSLSDPSSIASLLPKVVAALEDPVVGVVDGGRLYDPQVDEFTRGGKTVFRFRKCHPHLGPVYRGSAL